MNIENASIVDYDSTYYAVLVDENELEHFRTLEQAKEYLTKLANNIEYSDCIANGYGEIEERRVVASVNYTTTHTSIVWE